MQKILLVGLFFYWIHDCLASEHQDSICSVVNSGCSQEFTTSRSLNNTSNIYPINTFFHNEYLVHYFLEYIEDEKIPNFYNLGRVNKTFRGALLPVYQKRKESAANIEEELLKIYCFLQNTSFFYRSPYLHHTDSLTYPEIQKVFNDINVLLATYRNRYLEYAFPQKEKEISGINPFYIPEISKITEQDFEKMTLFIKTGAPLLKEFYTLKNANIKFQNQSNQKILENISVFYKNIPHIFTYFQQAFGTFPINDFENILQILRSELKLCEYIGKQRTRLQTIHAHLPQIQKCWTEQLLVQIQQIKTIEDAENFYSEINFVLQATGLPNFIREFKTLLFIEDKIRKSLKLFVQKIGPHYERTRIEIFNCQKTLKIGHQKLVEYIKDLRSLQTFFVLHQQTATDEFEKTLAKAKYLLEDIDRINSGSDILRIDLSTPTLSNLNHFIKLFSNTNTIQADIFKITEKLSTFYNFKIEWINTREFPSPDYFFTKNSNQRKKRR